MRKGLYTYGHYVGILVWSACDLCNFYFEIYPQISNDRLGLSTDMVTKFNCIFNRITKNGLDQSVSYMKIGSSYVSFVSQRWNIGIQ